MKRWMKNAMKRFYPVLIVATLVVIGAIVLMSKLKNFSLADLFSFDWFKTITRSYSGPVILEAIQTEAKLETIAMVERTENYEEEHWGVVLVKPCRESITYYGYFTVTAGVDLKQITESDIVVTDGQGLAKTVTIALPPATILHAEVDDEHDSIQQHEWLAVGLVCGGSRLDQLTLRAQQKGRQDAINAALAKGILEKAQTEAGTVLQQLLNNAGYPNVLIKSSQGDYLPGIDD